MIEQTRVIIMPPGRPAIVVALEPGDDGRLVPVSELMALRRTAGELLLLVEALHPAPGAALLVQSAQGLARALVARLASVGAET